MIPKMNQRGFPMMMILLVVGLIAVVYFLSQSGAGGGGNEWCEFIKQKFRGPEGTLCSNEMQQFVEDLPANQIILARCNGTWELKEDCAAGGGTCVDANASTGDALVGDAPYCSTNPVGDLNGVIAIQVKPAQGQTPAGCDANFSELGTYKGNANAAYTVCVQKGGEGVIDVEAPELTEGDAACSDDFSLLQNLEGTDEKIYSVCQKTGGPGLLDITSQLHAGEGTGCPADYSRLQTLRGADEQPYLICVKRSTVSGECACPVPADNACGTDLWTDLPAACQATCERFGTQCSEGQTGVCDVNAGTCLDQGSFDCGTPIGDSGIRGVRCEEGFVCNLELNHCIEVGDSTFGALSLPKYAFDLFNPSDEAEAINACFAYSGDAETVAKDGELVHIAAGSTQSSDALSFEIAGMKLSNGLGKGGVLPFGLTNATLTGAYNYSLLRVSDAVRGEEGPLAHSESFVVKIMGRGADTCYSESGLEGKTGPVAAPRIRYNWSYDDTIGIGMNACDEKKADGSVNPNYIYCDATQFSIELVKKLNTIVTAAEGGTPLPNDSALLDFNAFMMADGFSGDFRKDFDFLQNNVAFFESSAAYTKVSPYFTSEERLVLPGRIQKPGKYRVQVSIGFPAGKTNVFFENGAPIATVLVSFSLLEETASQNQLYFMPLDFMVGSVARSDEPAADRQGYGIGLNGSLGLTGEFVLTTVSAANAGGTYDTSTVTQISEVSSLFNRGVVMAIAKPAQGNGSIVFSPVRATPVVLRIPMIEGKAQAFFELAENESALSLGGNPIALWSGAGSTTGDPCADFSGSPLLYNSSEPASAVADSCAANAANAKGFFWTSESAAEQKVFYKGVVYTPAGNFSLRKAASCEESFDMLTPSDKTSASQRAVSLGYWDGGFTVLSNVVAGISNRSVCVFNSNEGSVFYWNRDRVLDLLENPQNFVPQPTYSQTDVEGFTRASVCRATSALSGG